MGRFPFWKEVDDKYLVEKGRYIDPMCIRPSASARDVRDSGVTLLYENLKAQGWSKEKGLRVKELSVGSDGMRYYGCIDGMHRVTALKKLAEEEERELLRVAEAQRESKRYWTRLKVLASVYASNIPRAVEIQLAVEANKSTSVMVRMTMFDMLSSMGEVRKSLMEDHNKLVREEEAQGNRGDKGASNKTRKKQKGDLGLGMMLQPSEVPKEWVTGDYYGEKGSIGSYARSTVGTFCSLLYRFDHCPLAWEELKRLCGSPKTEKAVNNTNLYTSEFSEELPDLPKYWLLRRLCGEYKKNGKSVSKNKSKEMMGRTLFVLREVEKLCKVFETDLSEFQFGSAELQKKLKDGIENGMFDKEIPRTKEERKAMNENPACLLSTFEQFVEQYHPNKRKAVEEFQQAKLRESSKNNVKEKDGEEARRGGKKKKGEEEGEKEKDEEEKGAEEEEEQNGEEERDEEEKDEEEQDEGEGGEVEENEDLSGRKRTRGSEKEKAQKKAKTMREGGRGDGVASWVSEGGECRIFGQGFEDFLGSEEFKKIKGKARLVLTDPPYNVLKGVEHDRITEKQMRRFANGAYDLLDAGGCLLVFCSWQQLARWTKYLEKAGFLVCPTPLHVIMMRNVQRRSNFFQNIVEYCIFAIAKVKNAGDGNVFLRWKSPPVYTTEKGSFPAHTNCVLHNPGPNGEGTTKLMKEDGTPWRTQEKPVELLCELILRFSSASSLVVDLFAGTLTTALAACKLGRQFVGCEVDVELFQAAKERVKSAYEAVGRDDEGEGTVGEEVN